MHSNLDQYGILEQHILSLSSCLCATGTVHKVNTPVRNIWRLAADFVVPEHTEQF